MTFKEYLHQAWSTHASEPRQVADEMKKNLSLVSSSEDIISFAGLVVHVCAEHLGDWLTGLDLLKRLKNNPLHKDKASMNRYVAILELGNNPATIIDHFSPSDQVRILAATASALGNLGGLKRAEAYLRKALEVATTLPKDDPAHKAMAMTGNNLASTLELKKERSAHETELMILAASIGREFWEIAGTWKEVERAEYRLARTYLEAEVLDRAFEHAEKCLEIVSQNGSEPLEYFFGFEVLALVEKAKKNQLGYEEARENMKAAFDKLPASEQSWCKKSLDKV